MWKNSGAIVLVILITLEILSLKIVFLLPRRIVPPISPGWNSGISITSGLVVSGSISVVFASYFAIKISIIIFLTLARCS